MFDLFVHMFDLFVHFQFVDMHAEIIAERMNKSSEKPPTYALATKEINLPPPKYEDIVI